MSRQAVGILGTGSYLPETEISNEEIAARVPGATPKWIEQKTMIRSRRLAAADEATSDLASKAALRALRQADVSVDRVDYIVVATSTLKFRG